MKRLLDDYIFSDSMRYEQHRMIYGSKEDEQVELGGFLGAAVLGALLYGKDEGEARNIRLKTSEGRKEFFSRYEDELLHENGGLFHIEVEALWESYISLNIDTHKLLNICGNERLYDLSVGLMVEYMNGLVREQICEHIYDAVPWRQPFAQWLYDAGFVETGRQQLLAVNWSNPTAVCSFVEKHQKQEEADVEPTFVFAGHSAQEIINSYWNWLWNSAQTEASLYPDAKVQLAEFREAIRKDEIDWDFLKPKIRILPPTAINLFNKWKIQWTDFVQSQIQPPPATRRQKKDEEQLFFPETTLKCPTGDEPEKYAATREYVKERSKFDEKFRKYVKDAPHTKLCHQLTLLFGWYVDPNSLRKSMLRKPKRKRKQYT